MKSFIENLEIYAIWAFVLGSCTLAISVTLWNATAGIGE